MSRKSYRFIDIIISWIHEFVIKLYNVLKDCKGNEFDRVRLMAIVKECRTAMNGFKGWYLEAQKLMIQEKKFKEKLKEKTIEIKNADDQNKQLENQDSRSRGHLP